jgi:hypothetical protein
MGFIIIIIIIIIIFVCVSLFFFSSRAVFVIGLRAVEFLRQ